jgi:hypothetical protein
MHRILNNNPSNKKDEKPLKAKLLNYRKNKKQILVTKETQKQKIEQQQTQIIRNDHPPNTFEQVFMFSY